MFNKLEKIKPCKLCGTQAGIIKSIDGYFHVVCNYYKSINDQCKQYIGILDENNKVVWHKKKQEAIKFWNDLN